MRVGDRFTKDGKLYEVTSVISDTNYGFKPVADSKPVEEPVFDPKTEADLSFEEEIKTTAKGKRGRKKV